MSNLFRRARRGLAPVVAVMFCVALLIPAGSSAQSFLAPGEVAVITHTGGDVILLRAEPGFHAAVLDHLSEGQQVEIIEGPTTSDDGMTWYGVSTGNVSGYVASDYVAASTNPASVSDASAVQQPQDAGGGGTAMTTSALNLREGPDISAMVTVVIPSGASISVDGGTEAGFYPVTWNGVSGWASAEFISFGGNVNQSAVGGNGSATATSYVNFRTGPGTGYPIIAVIPAGMEVPVTGESADGYLEVIYSGYLGWTSAEFLSAGQAAPAPEPESPPAPAPDPEPAPEISTAQVTSGLHLRSGPSVADASLAVMPEGATVSITGEAQNGFLPVVFDGTSGWAYAEFLGSGDDPDTDDVPAPPTTGGSGIIWPVSGGTWSIIQGYNGGTHQNRSSSAQYYYALDIARSDGNTAGEAVYAPAFGTVLWTDPGSGGIAIDMGNGYTIAMFHLTIDGGLSRGQSVTQGQYVGTISGPGGPGYASTPHIDMTLWQTSGGGRSAAPYTGSNSISGMEFADNGGWNQHGGTEFTP